jgi:hypothetical protein
MVKMLAFSAADKRLASSEPEVSAPFHIGHCASAVVATPTSTNTVATTATRLRYAKRLMAGVYGRHLIRVKRSRKWPYHRFCLSDQ